MPYVTLRAPLKDRAGGNGELTLDGATVGEVLRALERDWPKTVGWVLDEQGRVRPHVNVFVNGERVREDAAVAPEDRLHVLPSILGRFEMTEVLVGTKKGLFVLRGGSADGFEVVGRAFAGDVVEYATRDPRTGRVFASVTSGFYGPRLMFSDGDPLGEWQQADGPAFPEGGETAVERIWRIEPGEADGLVYAGAAPASLFISTDGGETWTLNEPLWKEREAGEWNPGAGGLALHSICPWPGDPDRLAVGVSAAGVWITEDGGQRWRTGYSGLVPRYMPEEERATTNALCVHNMYRSPASPERFFMQFHGGVYRSDDAASTWNDIGAGLPSDFGFPLVIDPGDPDGAYVIPLVGAEDRVTPEGKLRVYETRDAGATWTPRDNGLPQRDAYLTIYRQAFGSTGAGDEQQLFFGATSGEVFCSLDAGRTWFTAADRLAPVTSVRAA